MLNIARLKANQLPQLTILLTVLLATSSESMASPRKSVQQNSSPVAAVPKTHRRMQ